MTYLNFPDVNVWLALLLEDHIHRAVAIGWWESASLELIGFTRFTQLGVLRILTTPAAMNGRPLSMAAAWAAYDQLFEDDLSRLSESHKRLRFTFGGMHLFNMPLRNFGQMLGYWRWQKRATPPC